MATCKTCSVWRVVDSGEWLNGNNRQLIPLKITSGSIVSLAGCAEMQKYAMDQSAEVTMNR
jgi:hypothetical protein